MLCNADAFFTLASASGERYKKSNYFSIILFKIALHVTFLFVSAYMLWIQALNYSDQYCNDIDFEQKVKMLAALAYVSLEDVCCGFELLNFSKCRDLPFELLH